MVAWTAEELAKRKRRKRLVQALVLGTAAVGVPALANAWVRARARRLEPRSWGRSHRYAWDLGDVVFERLGEGPAVVLLHSFGPGHDAQEWRPVAERMARNWQVFAVDWLGWGRSDRPTVGYEPNLYMDLLIDFLLDIVRRRAVVLASGHGAAYAVQVAADRPELIRALVLVCPVGLGAGAEEPELSDAFLCQLLRTPLLGTSAANLFTSKRALRRHLEEELFYEPSLVTDELVGQYWASAHRPAGRGALGAWLAGYLNHSVAPALPRLRTPTLLVWGSEARLPELPVADHWLQGIPTAQLAVLPECRALPHTEKPEGFLARVEPFLDALPGP